jgi:hypothetical protein
MNNEKTEAELSQHRRSCAAGLNETESPPYGGNFSRTDEEAYNDVPFCLVDLSSGDPSTGGH